MADPIISDARLEYLRRGREQRECFVGEIPLSALSKGGGQCTSFGEEAEMATELLAHRAAERERAKVPMPISRERLEWLVERVPVGGPIPRTHTGREGEHHATYEETRALARFALAHLPKGGTWLGDCEPEPAALAESPAKIQPLDVARDVERAELVDRLERDAQRYVAVVLPQLGVQGTVCRPGDLDDLPSMAFAFARSMERFRGAALVDALDEQREVSQ